MHPTGAESLSARPHARLFDQLQAAIDGNGGWLPFDRYMALVLYAPGLGYYARDARQFGHAAAAGIGRSDFVTAPELSPLFGAALARQVAQLLRASATDTIYEFGAGTGALAAQLLAALAVEGLAVRYVIVDLSASLRQRQQRTLAAWAGRVQWLDALPPALAGVVVGNEVLDAMPVQLLHFDGQRWFERGVALNPAAAAAGLCWADRETALRPPGRHDFPPATTTEIHVQAEAFVATLAERLVRGAVLLIDYGFHEAAYYHPQRSGGTVMCHRAHRADSDPLQDPGDKDITAHVNFSAVALAAQDAGLDVLGYASQAHFLMNCGLLQLLQGADVRTIANAQKLLTEHEMGELFKVLLLGKGLDRGQGQGRQPAALAGGAGFEPLGFVRGDRMHTL